MIRSLSARSVVLSLLLGAHPPELTARQLVTAGETFGISEATLRVALTRMVAAGDLVRTGAGYRLSPRLVDRQRRQDESIDPQVSAWRGAWEMAVVSGSGRAAAERAALRDRLAGLRLAELREGLWLRPDNLRRPWPDEVAGSVQRFVARPDAPAPELAAQLWDLEGWSATGRLLLAGLAAAADQAGRIAAAAGIVRHLLTDPLLPAPLLPDGWPGRELRAAYADYQTELMAFARAVRSA